jgi:hypothetical protein
MKEADKLNADEATVIEASQKYPAAWPVAASGWRIM